MVINMSAQTNSLFATLQTDYGKKSIEAIPMPDYITNNIKYPLFDWQKKSLQYFLQYQKSDSKKIPTHLLFNMATGSGKTLIMGAMILYYYKQGYRKFIFFNNCKNIVGKTEDNFINKQHQKYVFTDKIIIDDKQITIKAVNVFSQGNKDDIEIKFTTIHKLHGDMYVEKENQNTRDDLLKYDIVMLGDEAHHLNATTKQDDLLLEQKELGENAKAEDIEKSWEHTVNKILLQKNGSKNNKNILLEFTATIPDNVAVQEKYQDKIIFKFPLRDFVLAGYTKEINVISSSADKKQRILLSLLFNWYRQEIAMKNNIANFKSVILFRSKTIDDSRNDYQEFLSMIKSLSKKDFDFIRNWEALFLLKDQLFTDDENGTLESKKIFDYIKQKNLNDVISFIKDNFTEKNCIITNSKDNKAKEKEKTDDSQDKLLNNLDDKHNHVRAIFTVQRLTEGWDVLNLFDIVRLYKGRDENKATRSDNQRKAGKTTIAEVQLIGRGVRYFPFAYQDKEKNKRKFDGDLNNELRILEKFFYHSDNNHKYISELKQELKRQDLIIDERQKVIFRLKDSFKNDLFYKNFKLYKNERIENKNRKNKQEYKTSVYEWRANIFSMTEQQINMDTPRDNLINRDSELKTIDKKFSDIIETKKHIALKAINILQGSNRLAEFSVLSDYIDIKSVNDFFNKIKNKNVIIKKSTQELSNKEWLKFFTDCFNKVFAEIKQHDNPYVGTEFEATDFNKIFGEAKEKIHNSKIEGGAINDDWYILEAMNDTSNFYGTNEELNLVHYIKENFSSINENYSKKFLLRNEEQYKIFDFETGEGFCPDFLLLLNDENFYYQVIIEAKGEHLLERDEWKNDFLDKIYKKYGNGTGLSFGDDNYKIIGLPMYNNQPSFKDKFNKAFKSVINPYKA